MSLIKGEAKKELSAKTSPSKEERGKGTIIKNPRGQEVKVSENLPKTSLLKQGSVAYEPLPIFDGEHFEKPELDKESPLSTSSSEVLSVYAVDNAEEEARKIKEEAVRFLAKAKEEAQRITAEAQDRAKKLIEQSKLYCETAHANAEREGYKEGEENGRKSAYEELKGVMDSTKQTLKQVKLLHENLAKSMEPGIARLALKVAEKIIASEVTLKPDVVINMVRSQLEKVKEREQIIIRVHPNDLDLVRQKREFFAQLLPGVRLLEIQGDTRVERGGCMIETNIGTVDACISTQLSAIEIAFSELESQEPSIPEEEELEAPEPFDEADHQS